MTTPVTIDPTDVTDAASTGSTRAAEIGERVDADAPATSSGSSLKKLDKKSKEETDETSKSLDTINTGAREIENTDAQGAGNLSSVAAPPDGTGGGGGMMAAPMGGAMGGAPATYPAPSMPQMAAQMAAPLAATAMQAPMMAAQPAMMAAAPAAAAAPSGYALTPSQQAALLSAASSGDSGGAGRSLPMSSSIAGGGEGFKALAAKLAGANIPYAWGGGTLEGTSKGISDGGGAADAHGDYNKVGFDCSGLSRYMVYQETGVEIPRVAAAQYAASTDVGSNPQPGDLVFPPSAFNGGDVTHVQVYVGDGQVIEAPQSGDVVKYSALQEGSQIRRPNGVD